MGLLGTLWRINKPNLSFHVKVCATSFLSLPDSSPLLRHNTTQARPASPAFVCVTDAYARIHPHCPAGSAWENVGSHWDRVPSTPFKMYLTLRGSPVLGVVDV